jgi:sec-independent protein translocase protein TatA
MFGIGAQELVLILIIILILFGVGKLPEIGKGLGRGIKEFRDATKPVDEIDVAAKEKKAEPESEKKA